MVLALQAIISLPSRDIAPAVQAHLVHLVSHKSFVLVFSTLVD